MIKSFKALKYFSSAKISFFLFASLWKGDLKLENIVFLEILTHVTIGLMEKELLFPVICTSS